MTTVHIFDYSEQANKAEETANAAKAAIEAVEFERKRLERMEARAATIKRGVEASKRYVESMIEHAMTDDEYREMEKWHGVPSHNTRHAYTEPFNGISFLYIQRDIPEADRKALIVEWAEWLESKIDSLPNGENPYSPRKAVLMQLAKARANAAMIDDGGETIADQRKAVERARANAVEAEKRRKVAAAALQEVRAAEPLPSTGGYVKKLIEEKRKLGI